MKRWIYVYLSAGVKENSIQRKIRNQIDGLKSNGIEIRGIFFTSGDISSTEALAGYENITYVFVGPPPNGYFRSIKEKRQAYLALRKWLFENKKNYDFIYMRYESGAFLFYKICRVFGAIMGLEYQTKNLYEIKQHYSENPFGLRPSRILSWLEYQAVPIMRETIVSRLILGRVRFIVGVTREIADWEWRRKWFGSPGKFVLGNGIRVSEMKRHEESNYDGKCLKLLMLVGASGGNDWNGLDRIFHSIKAYKGAIRIELHIAGNTSELDGIQDVAVVRHGYLIGAKLEKIISDCHIALGAFALDRKNLREGSTLKMREYAARGIPCVYGHFDQDYEGLVALGLALRCDNYEAPDMQSIVEFAGRVLRTPDYSQVIRKYALDHLDFTKKMSDLARYFREQETAQRMQPK